MSEGFLPALLITFREVLEATLIVATILTILVKLKQTKGIRNVWMGTGAAVVASLMTLVLASVAGIKLQEAYSGRTEELIEGILMIVSAVFVTWAVFFLHTHFAQQKVKMLQKIKRTVEQEEQRGLFALTFVAVFREGIEIVLFLSTIYLSSTPREILSGFFLGMLGALLVSIGLFTLTLRFPVYWTFRITSWLLVAFAAGLLARGVHQFTLFGLRRAMDVLQIVVYGGYIGFMAWVLQRREKLCEQ